MNIKEEQHKAIREYSKRQNNELIEHLDSTKPLKVLGIKSFDGNIERVIIATGKLSLVVHRGNLADIITGLTAINETPLKQYPHLINKSENPYEPFNQHICENWATDALLELLHKDYGIFKAVLMLDGDYRLVDSKDV